MDHYGYGYDEGFEAGRRQAKVDKAVGKAAGDIGTATGSVLGLLITGLFHLVMYSGALILSYYIVDKYNLAAGQTFKYKALTLASVAFGINCMLFLLKGMLISLKAGRNILWRIIWAVIFLVICVIPVLTIQRLIAHWFDSGSMKALAWLPATFVGIMIYLRYRLTEDYAPMFMNWIYGIGKAIA